MPTGIIHLQNTTNNVTTTSERLYNYNGNLHFEGNKLLTYANVVGGDGIQVTSDPSSNTITIKNTFNTYSSSGTFFQLPMFILNSPTNSYQYMKIQSSSYDSEYITYIVPKNISIKNLTLISNDINDEYVIKITNLNLTGTNFIETTITMSSNTEIRQSTSNLSFSEGHKMTVEIKNTSQSSTTEYILLLIDSYITINNNWIENENKIYILLVEMLV